MGASEIEDYGPTFSAIKQACKASLPEETPIAYNGQTKKSARLNSKEFSACPRYN